MAERVRDAKIIHFVGLTEKGMKFKRKPISLENVKNVKVHVQKP